MRQKYVVVGLLGALGILAGCASSPGPGPVCDECAKAEANPVGPGSSAAAASAAGGQRAHNAPFAEDTARLAPQTTVGRGTGSTESTQANSERREVASGGAQNIALMNPTSAEAVAGAAGGGVPPSVSEAKLTVAQWRGQLALVLTEMPYDPAKAEFVRTNLFAAQAALNEAEAAWTAARPNVSNTYSMGGDNTMIGVSTSKTGEAHEAIDPEAARQISEASARIRAEVTARRAAEAQARAKVDAARLGAFPEPTPAPAGPESSPASPGGTPAPAEGTPR